MSSPGGPWLRRGIKEIEVCNITPLIRVNVLMNIKKY
jgi:hypothetical protein